MVHRGFTYFLVWLIQSPDTPPGSCSKIPSQQWRSVQWNKIHKRPYLPQLVKQDPKVWCNSLPQDSVCSQNKLNLTWFYCMYILFYGIYLSCLPTDSVREAGGDPCLSNASPVCYTHKYTLFVFCAAGPVCCMFLYSPQDTCNLSTSVYVCFWLSVIISATG